jgi:hypothetical protein
VAVVTYQTFSWKDLGNQQNILLGKWESKRLNHHRCSLPVLGLYKACLKPKIYKVIFLPVVLYECQQLLASQEELGSMELVT